MVRRAQIELEGTVQGVGMRPYLFRQARAAGLSGFVRNTARGVEVEVEGEAERVQWFLVRLASELPPLAHLEHVDVRDVPPRGGSGFVVLESAPAGDRGAAPAPDTATCPRCLAELFDPDDRRYRYPFTNCTDCGPRLSILEGIPYDRPNTTMRGFTMCARCEAEYHDPASRRFHAQPNACPQCGPQLSLLEPGGAVLAGGEEALGLAERALIEGRIVALKGLGGFQLLCDARSQPAVVRLRERKRREEKPLAVMVPSLAEARVLCRLSAAEETALAGPQAPILLAERRPGAPVAEDVAPRSTVLGVFLPYTPLHHLLCADLSFPFVATSGNLTDDPIARDTEEALARLGGIADLFLVHDRPIARRVDDSVARVAGGALRVLRRARGFAPAPVRLQRRLRPVLAVGAHQKVAVAIAMGERVFVSQHLGDLDTPLARAGFEQAVHDLLRLHEFTPEAVACDLHPDYASTRFAETLGLPLVRVQHHHAHAAACLAEAGRAHDERALAATWDGTGLGSDGTIWGGEFLRLRGAGFERVAHLRPFRLPGGEMAVKEPRRTALALVWELVGEVGVRTLDGIDTLSAFRPAELQGLLAMLRGGVNCPVTSSVGRLFDAVASLVGLRHTTRFEGQAAMELEQALEPGERGRYPLPLSAGDPLILDWGPLLEALIADLQAGAGAATVSARFHNALAHAVAATAKRLGARAVALTGGCFQNAALVERTCERLSRAGVEALLHRQVPPNDGGIALGQAVVASEVLTERGERSTDEPERSRAEPVATG